MAVEMKGLALEPGLLARLVDVLEDELGHDLAFAVEGGKIAANSGDESARIELAALNNPLSCALPTAAMSRILDPHAETLREAARETLRLAGLESGDVERVIYVGGSSLMSAVSTTMEAEFKSAEHTFSNVFTAVADGLALASARRD
jgi:hypothetical chaperone protein